MRLQIFSMNLSGVGRYARMVNQKKMAPARLVWHQPGRPATKSLPAVLALGSVFGSLQPACVNTEMVVMKLRDTFS